MQKAKLGISVGLLAAAIYFMGLFSGYTVTILLVGYVLLMEEDAWLKKSAVKAVAIMAVFDLIAVLLNLVPNIIGVVDDIVGIFGGSFYLAFVSRLISAVLSVLSIIEKLMLLNLGIKALAKESVAVKQIDEVIDKHME